MAERRGAIRHQEVSITGKEQKRSIAEERKHIATLEKRPDSPNFDTERDLNPDLSAQKIFLNTKEEQLKDPKLRLDDARNRACLSEAKDLSNIGEEVYDKAWKCLKKCNYNILKL